LADFAVDPYGNLISAGAGGLANGSSEETKEGEDAAAAAPAASASDSLKMKKKRKKATAEPKKMSPKKMALIENKRKENEEFRKAYAQSQKIPKLEDRIHVVKVREEPYLTYICILLLTPNVVAALPSSSHKLTVPFTHSFFLPSTLARAH
jgi:hypothetical protein